MKILYDWKWLLILASAWVVSGCISSRAYVDPQYHKASYETIKRPATPHPVMLETQFQRNGMPLPAVDAELRGNVKRTLRATGVFVPVEDVPMVMRVTANNIADVAAARAKGFGTGLTFGAAGSTIDDNYVFTCSLKGGAHPIKKFSYKHAIHTTVGNTEAPKGMAPTTLADAFSRVVEDAVLNCVKDLQDQGLPSP